MKKLITPILLALSFAACKDSGCTDLHTVLQSRAWQTDDCNCIQYDFKQSSVKITHGCPALSIIETGYQLRDNAVLLDAYEIEITDFNCRRIRAVIGGCDATLK